MLSTIDSTGSNGPTPKFSTYVLMTASGSATVDLDIVDGGGNTIAVVTVTVTATPASIYTLVAAVTTWDDAMAGARLTEVATADVYWSTGGQLIKSSGKYVAAVVTAPTTTVSPVVPIGNYASNPYKMGMCG